MRHLVSVLCCLAVLSASRTFAAEYQVGVSRIDITPQEPLRLSGYGNRTKPSEGGDTPLYARALVLREGGGLIRVLVSVDTIGFPGDLTVEVAKLLKEKFGIAREDVVISSTHSHTAPQLSNGLSNLLAVPMTADERAKSETYTHQVRDRVVEAVGLAIKDMAPAMLSTSVGEATFARNRRTIVDGKWTGFGENPTGAVDHTVPCVKVLAEDGKTIRAVLFNYACHCTTFGPGHNRVNGDWAGYATAELEAAHPGMLAFSVIGCGADANPDREGPKQLELAKAQGHELAVAVEKQLAVNGQTIDASLQSTFGFAGIASDRPEEADLKKQLSSTQPQVRQHAENMLATLEKMGRLPETYPMPIHVWRFGDQFSMVFLGGEVVAEYALRVRKEFPTATWVSAYCDDVFGYVVSERMRAEGGYEVNDSMIFYNQPGRWSAGTEEVIFRRIHELYDNKTPDRPLSVEEALKSFSVPEGYEVDVVASEPQIVDPINFSVGPDGRLWVAEMRDYPLGMDGKGEPGGRIRVLSDKDGDGRYETAVTFIDKLRYVTGVLPWKDGAWVSAAPNVLFARDTDGDGTADEMTPWLEGFIDANPQHRINGFERGLDNWIYLAAGDSTPEVKSLKTGHIEQTTRRDMRFDPRTGQVEALGGQTQNARVRDDWGHWFGNTNSEPLMCYPMEDRDLRKNPFVPSPQASVRITDPEIAPPVYPTSRTVDRFNDLWAADRFTSACGTGFYRDQAWGPEMSGVAFVCEPVHNLVMRYKVVPDGVKFKAERFPEDQKHDFLASSDNWFRPTRAETAPDGSLWVVDMYRHVIEHPQWIPEAWQARLDLRAGEDKGRIYRVRKKGQPRVASFDMTKLTDVELATALAHANGWHRDTAQQLLVTASSVSREALAQIEKQALQDSGFAQLHSIAVLEGRGLLKASHLAAGLKSTSPTLVAALLKFATTELIDDPQVSSLIPGLVKSDSLEVRYQLALALGRSRSPHITEWLGQLIESDPRDEWLRAAILSAAPGHAEPLLTLVIQRLPADDVRAMWVAQLVATSLADQPEAGVSRILKSLGGEATGAENYWKVVAVANTLKVLSDRGFTLAKLSEKQDAAIQEAISACRPVLAEGGRLLADEQADTALRASAVTLAGQLPGDRGAALEVLNGFFTPQTPIQLTSAAVERLAALEAVEGILAAWGTLSPIARREAQTVLTSRAGTALTLLKAVETKQIPASDLDAATRTALTQSPDERIASLAKSLLMTSGSSSRQAVIEKFKPALELSGDDVHGRMLFEKKCATCHKHRELGNQIGPQLSALTNKSGDFLIRAILDPNQAIESKYTGYVATTKDGRVFTGMITDETATSLTLAKADGKKDTLLRVDLDELKSTGKSFMPEGLELEISPQDLADIFKFVQGQ